MTEYCSTCGQEVEEEARVNDELPTKKEMLVIFQKGLDAIKKIEEALNESNTSKTG